jgi:hypothetical protein
VLAATGCLTGERPTLGDAESGDPAATAVLGLLESGDDRPATIRYRVLRKFGNTAREVVVARDRTRWSLTVDDVRFLDIAGSRSTCDLSTGRCSRDFDEAEVSDAVTTVRFTRQSPATRLRRDARDAVAPLVGSTRDIAGSSSTCVLVPLTNGDTFYCANDLGVIALQDTADIRIEIIAIDEAVDPVSFATTRPG